MFRLRHGVRIAAAAAGVSASSALAYTAQAKSKPDGLTFLRNKDFPLQEHYHGKARVRVLRVQHAANGRDTVQEFNVQTRLFSSEYHKVFTKQDNSGLVATDTQKNTVYVLAQRSSATSPEGYAIDLCKHLLEEYPILEAVEVDVREDLWRRVHTATGEEHNHGFVREAPERATASVRLTRAKPREPIVVSGLEGLTVLKTTQSGFDHFLHDSYTLLPDTQERCLATEMKIEWCYPGGQGAESVDYGAVRSRLRSELLGAFFGPPKDGIFSVSLQATIYDAGCMVLKAVPAVKAISIYTPNIHMIPFMALKQLGPPDKAQPFRDDVYVATSDPAGTIFCTVSR